MINIDFVVTWVDGYDTTWQEKMLSYKGTKEQKSATRFRDWEIFKYWFRAVDEYAPWVHHVFLITDNQKPSWLNMNNLKLTVIDHKDYIPESYLPTFNSNCIEANFHRIKGLSEYFVAFNDDMYINQPVTPEYYFKDGKPCVSTLEHIFDGRAYYPDNGGWGISMTDWMNTQVLNAHFNREEVTKKNPQGWYGSYLGRKYQLQAYILKWFHRIEFQHFYTPHNEKAFLKTTFEKIWQLEPDLMNRTCSRFREATNLNIYLMRYWQMAENNFYPVEELSKKKVVQLHRNNMSQLQEILFNPTIKSLCLNDSSDCSYEDYLAMKPRIVELFEKKFPHKSSFEV